MAATPTIPTSFTTDAGTALPVLNVLEVLGGTGLGTTGAGNTVTINLDTPVTVANGGTGQTSYTDGQLLIGNSTGNTLAKGTITAGAGISVTNAAGSITITATGGAFTWTTVIAAAQALAVENGYVGNRATAITYTLPATASVGESFQITNIGAGLPVIAQNAGQSINFTASTTTVGVGGSLTAIDQFASIEIVCVVADTTWTVLDATGNWTVT